MSLLVAAASIALVALLSGVQTAGAAPGVLYDQMAGGGGIYLRSTDFTDADGQDAWGADDFVVPAGEVWTIESVEVSGLGPAPSVDVLIYANSASNLPGAVVFSALDVVPDTAPNDLAVAIGPLALGPGTYWLSVRTNDVIATAGWFWEMHTPVGFQSAYQNTTSCTDWGYRISDCNVASGNPGTPDFAFRLLGTSVDDADGPETSNVTATPNPVAVGHSSTLVATVDDSATGGSTVASAEYSLDGGATWNPMAAADGSFDEVGEAVTVTFSAPAVPAIHDLCVRGTDGPGNVGAASCIQLVVYDPSGGFATGGGWIDSPAGAYPADPAAAGRATFAFVSKYRKGATAPTGAAQFVFQAAGLEFRSTSYQWLVVNQAGTNAQFKGTGTIDGLGPYDFMVWATEATASTPASLRIRITDGSEAIYDNGFAQPIGGGAIIVHRET